MRVLGLWLALVTAWGVEPVFAPQDRPALPPGRWVPAEVTCYCPCSKCTDGDKRTANNTSTDAVPYNLAADRRLKMGTRVYVPRGMGVLDNVRATRRLFTVDDRGGALETEAQERNILRLDVRVMDHDWAMEFGRRHFSVYVVDP